MGPLRLTLFGVPALRDGAGRPRPLRSRKQLGVLLYLVLEGREQSVSRDLLVELLWDDVAPERGRHSFAQACTAIRGAVGRASLLRVGDGVRLGPALATDLDHVSAEFDTLPLAEPLLEADRWAGPDWAHWVDGTRERLRRAAHTALRDAIDGYRLTGETSRVHACAAVLYQLDPLSDVAVQALAERELIRGDVVGAIRLLRAHLTRLQESLGCVPQVEVARLLRRLEAGAHPPVELLPARLAAEAPKLRPAVFVGREKELAQLEGEWQQARRGGFRSCLVLGPGGIGKSSLVRRFAATVAARAQPIFVITCQEIGQGIPFAAIADLVTALSRDPSVAGADPKWLAEVSRIHPTLRTVYPGIPEPPDAPPESIRLRLAEGLAQMLDAVADQGPVGIVFDDLQFMDPATRDVLHVLSRHFDNRGVLLVATLRTLSSHRGLTTALQSVEAITWDASLWLTPLDPTETRHLVVCLTSSTPEAHVVSRIVGLSEGNPHFIEMLVADWEAHSASSLAYGRGTEQLPSGWQPPDSLRRAFARLYAGLNEVAQQLLHVLAVARRSIRTDEAAGALALPGRALDEAGLELLGRGLLRMDAGALCFKSELHRAFVYYAISEDTRRFYHAKLGLALLERARLEERMGDTLEAAHHLSMSGRIADAAKALLRGARIAITEGGAIEGEAALRLVLGGQLDPTTRTKLKLLLAESLSLQGRYAETLEALSEYASDRLDDMESRALASLLRAQALQRTRLGDDETVKQAAKHALVVTSETGNGRLVAAAAQIAAEAASEMGLPEMMANAVDRAEELISRSLDRGVTARALLTKGFCLMASGRFKTGSDSFRESARFLATERNEPDLARALNGQAICLMAQGAHADCVSPLLDALAVATGLSDQGQRLMILVNLGVAYEELGMFPEAGVCYAEALAQDTAGRHPRETVIATANLVHISVMNGDLETALKALLDAQKAAERSRLWRLSALVGFVEADLLLSQGEAELAWPIVSRAAKRYWGAARAIDTNGKALRLMLHCALATSGPESLARQVDELASRRPALRLSDSLELRAFLRWLKMQKYLDSIPAAFAASAANVPALLGHFGALAAVGVFVEKAHELQSGESAGEMLDRVYPRANRRLLLPHPSSLLNNESDPETRR